MLAYVGSLWGVLRGGRYGGFPLDSSWAGGAVDAPPHTGGRGAQGGGWGQQEGHLLAAGKLLEGQHPQLLQAQLLQLLLLELLLLELLLKLLWKVVGLLGLEGRHLGHQEGVILGHQGCLALCSLVVLGKLLLGLQLLQLLGLQLLSSSQLGLQQLVVVGSRGRGLVGGLGRGVG